jgi:hypothetical protein
LSSGLRAEYNNEYYANLAVSVITRGIEEKRNELRGKIQAFQNKPYPDYDIAAAVTDAVKYDGSCNIVNGLELANEAIQRLNEPGRDAMNRALLKNKLTSALASSDTDELKKLKTNLDALSIHTDALFNNFTHVAGITSGTTYQSVYNSGNILAGGSSANAALTLGTLLGALHTLETEATERVKASVSPGVTPSAATITAAISAALQTLSAAISADFSGTGTFSCFTEAKEIAVELAKKQSALALAKRASPEVRTAQDELEDALVLTQQFAEKLRRYTQTAVEFKTDRLKQLDTINEPKTDSQKLIKTIQADWTKEQLVKGIGDARRCKPKAPKEPPG